MPIKWVELKFKKLEIGSQWTDLKSLKMKLVWSHEDKEMREVDTLYYVVVGNGGPALPRTVVAGMMERSWM